MKLGINERLKGKKLYKEVWRDIEGYEGLYQVSNMGRVRSLDRTNVYSDGRKVTHKGMIMKPYKNNKGYNCVHIGGRKGKVVCIYRLVAMAFVDGYFEGAEVDHIIPVKNGGKDIWTNLRWVTHKENMNNPLTINNTKVANKGKNSGENNGMYGVPSPMTGKHHTEESKKKMSEKAKGRIISDKQKQKISESLRGRGKKVICIETGKIYCNAREASEKTGACYSKIGACCRGERKTCGGFHWEYYEEVV